MRFPSGSWVVLAALAGLAPACATEAAGQRDYAWFLRQVADLDRLTLPDDTVVSRQFSSYNRASYYDRATGQCVGMDANGDAGHVLKVHSGPEAAQELAQFALPADAPRADFGDWQWILDPVERNHVFFLPRPGASAPQTRLPEKIVACIAGPGCIVRIWSADPRGKIRFYFDGVTTPLEFDFNDLFLKGGVDPDAAALANRRHWPFIRPMTYRRNPEAERGASDCYLPIPFAKSCIVALTEPSFYHVGYKTYPRDVQVPTFRLPLSAAEDAVLAEVCRKLTDRGQDPKPARPGSATIRRQVELPPGQSVSLAELTGPGVIQSIHARLQGGDRYAHSKVLLVGEFDDEREPCLWSPLVNFFGTGFGANDYRSLPLGYRDGEGYCYWPMPFQKRARLIVRNEGRKPVQLEYRIVHAPVAALPAGTLLFKCKYRREETSTTFDYPLLECQGRGRFVGAHLSIDDAWRSWWGEGDEKIWVDGDKFPSFFGTGSEDFFGDAWGIRPLAEPFFACSYQAVTPQYSRTSCYRWMIPDDVPFAQRFKITIENYPEDIWGTPFVKWDEDYVSTAYWYQAPGGTDFFRATPVESRRPWGKAPAPPCVEAEDVLRAELSRGAQLIDDEELPSEFSHGQAIDLGQKRPGDTVTFVGPELIWDGPYGLTIHTPPELSSAAAFDVLVNGRVIGQSGPDFGKRDVSPVAEAIFPKGRPTVTLRFTSAGRAVFDAFQWVPPRQVRDAVEAEIAKIVAVVGPQPVREIGLRYSGGRILRFPAAQPGQSLELSARIPPHGWDLVLGYERGPACGDFEVFLNGKSCGVLRGYAAQPKAINGWKLATVDARQPPVVRFVARGKDEHATGYELNLDYLGWKRVVVPYAIEGETAPVTDVRNGRITDQPLGREFSGQNHLWFHPQKVGATFTWLLDVPRSGDYDLAVYFTKSWDYAIVRVLLDEKPLGEYDTYAPAVTWGGKTLLGTFNLSPGEHRLRFEVVGRNERSKGILLGVDCLTLRPATGKRPTEKP